jgi:hypothetical protein
MVGWSKLTALTARMVIGSMIGLRLASCLGICGVWMWSVLGVRRRLRMISVAGASRPMS